MVWVVIPLICKLLCSSTVVHRTPSLSEQYHDFHRRGGRSRSDLSDLSDRYPGASAMRRTPDIICNIRLVDSHPNGLFLPCTLISGVRGTGCGLKARQSIFYRGRRRTRNMMLAQQMIYQIGAEDLAFHICQKTACRQSKKRQVLHILDGLEQHLPHMAHSTRIRTIQHYHTDAGRGSASFELVDAEGLRCILSPRTTRPQRRYP